MPGPVTGPWYVVTVATSGLLAGNTVATKPFPPGTTVVSGPYLTQALAQAALNASGAKQSSVSNVAPPSSSSPFTALGDIGNFFHALTQPATWTRVGEILAGGIILYAGIRALTHTSNSASPARKAATKPVKKAAGAVASVAVPEARVAGRVAAKRIAPKTTTRVASHRARVAKYGGRKPYQGSVRVSHVYHHSSKAKP
jgi:hypothetical protein